MRSSCVGNAFEGIGGIGMKLLVAETGNTVTGEQNQTGAFQFGEQGELGAHFGEERVELCGITQAGIDATAGVDDHVELMEAFAGHGEITVAPVLILIDELNGVVAGLGGFADALVKRKGGIDGPEHYGEWKRRNC